MTHPLPPSLQVQRLFWCLTLCLGLLTFQSITGCKKRTNTYTDNNTHTDDNTDDPQADDPQVDDPQVGSPSPAPSQGHTAPLTQRPQPRRRMAPITTPIGMMLQGAREPSGAVTLADKGGILVVDDEPKATDQSLGMFFYQWKGRQLRPLPVRMRETPERLWNDWEGLARTSTHVMMLTSHSKSGNKRARICRFARKDLKVQQHQVLLDGPLTCRGGKSQRLMIKSLIQQAGQHPTHGFRLEPGWQSRGPKYGGLDIEAIVYHPKHKCFYLGLRGPLVTHARKRWAIVLKMTWGPRRNHFQYAGLMDLGDRGIRAWSRDQKGKLWLIGGPMGRQGSFALFRLDTMPKQPFLFSPKEQIPKGRGNQPAPALHKVEAFAFWKRYVFFFQDNGDWDDEEDGGVLIFSPHQLPQK